MSSQRKEDVIASVKVCSAKVFGGEERERLGRQGLPKWNAIMTCSLRGEGREKRRGLSVAASFATSPLRLARCVTRLFLSLCYCIHLVESLESPVTNVSTSLYSTFTTLGAPFTHFDWTSIVTIT